MGNVAKAPPQPIPAVQQNVGFSMLGLNLLKKLLGDRFIGDAHRLDSHFDIGIFGLD